MTEAGSSARGSTPGHGSRQRTWFGQVLGLVVVALGCLTVGAFGAPTTAVAGGLGERLARPSAGPSRPAQARRMLGSRVNSPRVAADAADLYREGVLRTIPERCELEATNPPPERMRRRAITFAPSRVARSCGEAIGVSVASRSR